MQYIVRKLVFYVIAAWTSLTINFFLPRLIPGDPASRLFARIQDRLQPEQLVALKKVFGLSDAPLVQQYITYLSHVLRGDLGVSTSRFPTPVIDVIASGLLWTLILGGCALLISFALGTLLGIIGTWQRGRWINSILPPVFIFIGSFPYFWLAMVALYGLGFELGWFPLRHAYSDTLTPGWNITFLGSVVQHLILPATTIILVSIGGWMLGMRSSMIGTLGEDYIVMAEAKGLPQRRIMLNYAARNALLPVVTSFGISFGFIVSGALLTEIVFSYPGLGYQLFNAVQNLDYPLMQGILLMITLAVLGANFIVDIVYTRLDPRVRGQ